MERSEDGRDVDDVEDDPEGTGDAVGVNQPRRNGDEGDTELGRGGCRPRRKMLDCCSAENRRDEMMMLKLS